MFSTIGINSLRCTGGPYYNQQFPLNIPIWPEKLHDRLPSILKKCNGIFLSCQFNIQMYAWEHKMLTRLRFKEKGNVRFLLLVI